METQERPAREPGRAVRWYRPKLTKEQLASLNRRSDLLGFAQTGGYLAVLVATGSLFVWCCFHQPWFAFPALLLHGACCSFMVNGFHELVHDSVFKTKWLNRAFLWIFSFFGWYNPVGFWASHTEHHKYTLHAPDDLEVVQPETVTLKALLRYGIANPNGLRWTIVYNWRCARGNLSGDWEKHLFTKVRPTWRPAFHRWAAALLIGHGLIAVVSIATGWWPLIFALSAHRFFGSALQQVCNATQHIGLQDAYPDFRVCCRTVYLNPVLQFLYWHMNYHTEHHMFAGVPCYRLGKLHRLIRHELAPAPSGLIESWRVISPILKRQAEDPSYRYFPAVPGLVPSTAAEAAESRG